MFFIKSILANIHYYRKSALSLYLFNCFFFGIIGLLLGLISLGQHNLSQLKTQLANFSSEARYSANQLLTKLLHANLDLIKTYQLIYWSLLIIGVCCALFFSYYLLKWLKQDMLTFISANWSTVKISSYYFMTALLVIALALLTIIILGALFNDQYWQFLEAVNQHFLQRPLQTVQRQPNAFNPLFKNHLTDFSSDSLINPVLHDSAKQTLSNKVLRQVWQPGLALLIPVIGVIIIMIHHTKQKQHRDVI